MEDQYDSEFLNSFKKSYLETKIPDNAQSNSWKNVSKFIRLEKGSSYSYFRWSNVMFGIIVPLIALTGLVTYAQGSEPGEPLYQVKVLSDKFIGQLTKNPGLPVEKRADEVIEAVKENDTKKLDAAAQEYRDQLEETKKKANEDTVINKTTSSNGKLKQTLKAQQEKLKKVQPQAAAKDKPKIENVIEETEKAEKDIKGASISPESKENKGNSGGNSNGNRGKK